MDNKEFLREWTRMCHTHKYCRECELKSIQHSCSPYELTNDELTDDDLDKLIQIIEKWSKENQREE